MRSALTLFLLPAIVSALPSRTFPFSGITVFGDSLSDNAALPGSSFLQSGGDYPADPHYFTTNDRRWSNNFVWTERLESALGVPLTDYAVGGATSNNSFIPGALTNPTLPTFHPPSALDQFVAWNESKPIKRVVSEQLFVIMIGANDAFNAAGFNVLNPNATQINLTAVAGVTVSVIKAIVEGLVGAGAKHILLANYPDFSKAPISANFGPAFTAMTLSYVTTFTGIIQTFANTLKASGAQSGVAVSLADFHAGFNVLLADPAKFGFTNTTSCVVGTFGQPGYSICSTDVKVQNTFLFWDDVHPTTNGHKALATVAELALLETYFG